MCERKTGFFLDFYCQWPAVFKPSTHNWQDWNLTVLKLAGENSPYKRSWEVEIGLLGFNVTLTYVYRDTFDTYDQSPEAPLSDYPRNLDKREQTKAGSEV